MNSNSACEKFNQICLLTYSEIFFLINDDWTIAVTDRLIKSHPANQKPKTKVRMFLIRTAYFWARVRI